MMRHETEAKVNQIQDNVNNNKLNLIDNFRKKNSLEI